jgi:hypothetical protein
MMYDVIDLEIEPMLKKIAIIPFFIVTLQSGLAGAVFTNIKIRNISDRATNSVLMWTNITTLSQNWIVANQYVEVDYLTNHAVITGWGLQIYTHNKTNLANPRYKGTNDPAGMVDATYSNYLLPMAWTITTNRSRPPNPVERFDHTGFQNYDWHYLSDRKTRGFTNELDYFIPWNQGGIAWHESIRQMKPLKSYIYFAANFTGSFWTRYQTSQLRVEEYNNPEARFLKKFFLYTNAWSGSEPNHCTPNWERWGCDNGTMNFNYPYEYHSPGTSIRISLGPAAKGAWIWFESSTNGCAGWYCTGEPYGYDLTGATKLTFWVKGTNNYTNKLLAQIGVAGDSCGLIQNVDGKGSELFTVTTKWSQHFIPVTNKDMSHVSRAFKIGIWTTDPAVRIIYVDDIKYEK